jgi:hypothetical protein
MAYRLSEPNRHQAAVSGVVQKTANLFAGPGTEAETGEFQRFERLRAMASGRRDVMAHGNRLR